MINPFIRLLNNSNSLTFSNDTLKICLPDQFMKIAFGRVGGKKLNEEFAHLHFFDSTALSPFIPKSTLENKLFWKVLKLEFLSPIERSFDTAKKVYEKFNSMASFQALGLNVIPFLKNKIQNPEVNSFLSSLEKKEMLIGPIHGDFHLNNIMKNQFGELKIIDLDLSMRSWIRQFDLINVLVSEYILTQGLRWKDAFAEAWKHETELTELDPEWSKCNLSDKKIHFYLYYVKRTIDESIAFTSEDHLMLLKELGLSV